jgi:hypothetical protein
MLINLNNANKYGDTPKMEAVRSGKLRVFLFQWKYEIISIFVTQKRQLSSLEY